MAGPTLQNAKAVIDRLKLFTGLSTDERLGDFFGIRRTTVVAWRRRGTINLKLVAAKCPHLNLHWLLTGEGDSGRPHTAPTQDEIARVERLSRDIYVPLSSTPLAFQLAYWEDKLADTKVIV